MWGVSGLMTQSRLKRSRFFRIHPYVSFLYFLVVIILIMFSMHPVILTIAFLTSFLYSVYLGGRKQLIMNGKLLPIALMVCLINPLFNHQGVTILCYMNNNPITLESILFGLMSGLMIYDMILYFQIFHMIVTEDKLICIFSRLLPIGSLLLTMAFRFVPMYRKQYQNIERAQKCIGQDAKSGNPLLRIMNGISLISALITWCLENAIETSDSMKARGFTLKGRTYYQNDRMTYLDWKYFWGEVGLVLLILIGLFTSYYTVHYFPSIIYPRRLMHGLVYYLIFTLFCLIPFLMDIKEELLWHILRQKI